MPRLPIDYSKTIIYKICCNDVSITDIYVGHTTDIVRRRQEHKYNCNLESKKDHNQYKYQFIRENGGWDNWSLIPVEEYFCENVNQACIRERYWIEKLQASLNKAIPSRSHKEYYEQNKDKINEYKKEWYENNKEKITEYKKEWCENNKEKNAEKKKEYYQQNKDKFLEKAKKHYEQNKDKIVEYHKDFYEKNKDKLLEKITCECGGHYIFMSKARHFKTKKHQDFLSTINEYRQETSS